MPNDQKSIASPRTAEDFAALYDRYYPAVYRYVRYRVNSAADAEDLTAETFFRALDRLPTYRPEQGSFAAWLFTIARNLVNSHYRRQQRRRTLPLEQAHNLPDPAPDPERRALAHDRQAALHAALTRLPARDRDLLALKFAAGLSHREIACLTGLRENHVGVIVYRTLRRLRHLLEDEL